MAKQHAAAMEKIGERIRELCAARGLSLRALERRAGFGRNRLWPIVSGRKKPRGRTLLRIAKVLGVGALTSGRARIAPELDELARFPRRKRQALQGRRKREPKLPAKLFSNIPMNLYAALQGAAKGGRA